MVKLCRVQDGRSPLHVAIDIHCRGEVHRLGGAAGRNGGSVDEQCRVAALAQGLVVHPDRQVSAARSRTCVHEGRKRVRVRLAPAPLFHQHAMAA
jgi:hypothetical protein